MRTEIEVGQMYILQEVREMLRFNVNVVELSINIGVV